MGTPASSGGELLANDNSFDESSGEHWVSEEDGDEAASSEVGLRDSGVSQGRKSVLEAAVPASGGL